MHPISLPKRVAPVSYLVKNSDSGPEKRLVVAPVCAANSGIRQTPPLGTLQKTHGLEIPNHPVVKIGF
jgi:hypothetical protein